MCGVASQPREWTRSQFCLRTQNGTKTSSESNFSQPSNDRDEQCLFQHDGAPCHEAKQVSSISHTFGLTSDAGRKTFRERRDLHRTLSAPPQSEADSDEDDGLEETNMFYTETDVTLPSNLTRSSSCCVRELRGRDVTDGAQSGAAAVHVYQEMMRIYEKLQAERVSQQVWAAELCERERELQRRENTLLQHQRNIHKLRGAEEELQQQHQPETSELKEALKQKTKDMKRIQCSFDSLKEFNDCLKKQLHDVSEQKRTLESRCGKVQARLENLQRRFENSKAHSGRENVFPKAHDPKASTEEHPPSTKTSKDGGAHGPALKLTAVLLDWVVDEQLLEFREMSNITGRLPSLHHRCSTVLPLLVDFLHQMSVMESSLQLSLLRCIYCCLSRLQHSSQHAPLTSTLRRLGEEVSRGAGDRRRGSRVCPLYKSSCPHTRFLSSLIIIRSVSQVDVLAQALDVLSCDVRTDEGQQLFLRYRALSAVLTLLRGGSPRPLTLSVEILLQMSSQTRLLSGFLDECSNEEFFRCISLVLRNPRLDPALLEKMCVVLQKLSSIRKNKRLFEAFSLHLLLQEMHRTTDPTQTFLNINLSSILLNLGMLTRS
ncbi:coiled-coil domain-containing protein 138-like isoform X2 [Triplophysa rosa]|uniref:coiled-coil domain-containing protein 138-like isoform X2 n=1 Tax=Triplophysa rosa TaxID=992332 RepID=UPI00254634FE|nr:coiled-coil domain-containing protein 138-like isoform X2 [Triplophysa rosa]